MSFSTNVRDEVRNLALVPLFRQLEAHDLAALCEEVDQVFFKAGEVIFHALDPGDALYLIAKGTVRIWIYDNDVQQITLSELKVNDFFGELAVLDKRERSANATALTDSTLHRLKRDDFHRFMMRHPQVAVDLICEIGARMRQTNLLISQRVTRNVNTEIEKQLTFGQRIADKVATFGGSWRFIILYSTTLISWITVNTLFLARYGGQNSSQFDPYPYILLNLVLSSTAALQAPVILMSQKRATQRERFAAEQDFKVNLKTEVMLDELTRNGDQRSIQLQDLVGAIRALRARDASQITPLN